MNGKGSVGGRILIVDPHDNGESFSLLSHINPSALPDGQVNEPLFSEDPAAPGHLNQVARLAAAFAEAMFPPQPQSPGELSRRMGQMAGFWHDLGKYSQEFQRYLRRVTADKDSHSGEMVDRVDHSTAGAQHAVARSPGLGHLLAFVIAGHHAGLPDWNGTSAATLKARLLKQVAPWSDHAPAALRTDPGLPAATHLPPNGFAWAFYVRMLFSCLTDADFLATEAFMNPEQANRRPAEPPSMARLAERLGQYMHERFSEPDRPVQITRQRVLHACKEAAVLEPGFFSLNVPTGGGKTLSSLVFALDHAARHGLRRVICAIPFTSIIEQNAQVYREVFAPLGDGVVLEHHASLDPDNPQVQAARLAVENWEAPLIVTTNVQLFETLFANRPGRCRKLHRMARSVIVLDEAHTLPVALLEPCLAALRELVQRYGCTVVLSTATQPALTQREGFGIGLTGVREIMPDLPALHAAMQRVMVGDAGTLTLEETAERLAGAEQALVIVNTRRHARELYQQLTLRTPDKEGNFHLSALLCPQHRSRKLEQIKARLKLGLPCRVVSTQLVEAGVDVDFPLVYRAQAGLDSVAQAAGRCNREGKLPHLGQTWVFTPAEDSFQPKGELGQAADNARQVMGLPEYAGDVLSLAAMERYFLLHTWQQGGETGSGWDKKDIMNCFKKGSSLKEPFLFQFREAAEKFQWIEDAQQPVIIPWDDQARAVLARLQSVIKPEPALLSWAARALQRYVVTIPDPQHRALRQAGLLDALHRERFFVLQDPHQNYSEALGLIAAPGDYRDPAALMC